VKFIIRTSIDVDRITWRPGQKGRVPPEWVKHRLELFNNYCLQSILNQTEQDFDIWAFCGECYKDITSNYKWHPRVRVVYNHDEFIKDFAAKTNEDYITLARIDSDDLFYKDALKSIKENLVKDPNIITQLAFRTLYSWNRFSNVISRYHQSHPPCFVHTVPKKLYKDFDYFKRHHFTKHVGGSHNAKTLPKFYVCETRHDQSWTIRKRHDWSKSYRHDVMSEEEKLHRFKNGKLFAIEKEGLYNILKDFGIKKELI